MYTVHCTIVHIYLFVCVLSSSICFSPLREPTSVDVLDNDAHLEKRLFYALTLTFSWIPGWNSLVRSNPFLWSVVQTLPSKECEQSNRFQAMSGLIIRESSHLILPHIAPIAIVRSHLFLWLSSVSSKYLTFHF